MKPDNRQRRE